MFIFSTGPILNQSANMTMYSTPESKGETLTARQAGTERLMVNTALHATHTPYTQPVDYPRCLYSHMRSI